MHSRRNLLGFIASLFTSQAFSNSSTSQNFLDASEANKYIDRSSAGKLGEQSLIESKRSKTLFSSFGGIADGSTDCSVAFEKAVRFCASKREPVWFEPGIYYIKNAPGQVLNSLNHSVPKVDYEYIDLRALSGAVVLRAAKREAPGRECVIQTAPILKAERLDRTGICRLHGLVFDGGVSTIATSGSLGAGSFPSSVAMIEIRGYAVVQLDTTTMIASHLRSWHENVFARKIIAYDPNDLQMGVAYILSNIDAGAVDLYADGSESAEYQAPRSSSPIQGGRKKSRTALLGQLLGFKFEVKLTAVKFEDKICAYVHNKRFDIPSWVSSCSQVLKMR